VHERCCGLDIHKKLVVACLIVPGPGGKPVKEIRSFGTMTAELLGLADWLAAAGCTHVAMESTGVYWKPLYNLLEEQFALLLVNAQHIKAVPGRKTDVKDCEWIADLLRHGLLKASFVPDRPQRELRELTRYRTSLIRERSTEINRLQKTLEGANVKLASVATNIMGKSGREILAALVAGTTDPVVLADLAKERLRQKLPQLQRALDGLIGPHQRFLLAQQLAHIEFLDDAVDQVSAEIAQRLGPWEETLIRLDAIPGIGRRTAEILLAEIGLDMSRFPTAGHLASWSGMCPGHDESAGKRRSGATRDGNPWLKAALAEAAQAASRTKASYLAAQFHRLMARRGRKRAIVAVGHAILDIVYYMLRDGTPYRELGADYREERQRRAQEQQLVRKLEALGYTVSREPAVA
jgi:transposase